MLAWIDVETTDLQPENGQLLEVACVITNDALVEEAHTVKLIKPDSLTALSKANMGSIIWDIHSKSGLIKDLMNGLGMPLGFAEKELISFVQKHVDDPGAMPLCGNNIFFDRRWLIAHMPFFEDTFHYRSIDVSSIKESARRYAPQAYEEWDAQHRSEDKPHRALPDIRHSIAEYEFYLSSISAGNPFWMHPREAG